MSWNTVNDLCDIVRETSYAIHRYHRNGHLEKIYENALGHRLRKLGLKALQQHPLRVYDEDGTVLGEYFADLFVEDRLVVELKAVSQLEDIHFAIGRSYLKAMNLQDGLLFNFATAPLTIKRFCRERREPESVDLLK